MSQKYYDLYESVQESNHQTNNYINTNFIHNITQLRYLGEWSNFTYGNLTDSTKISGTSSLMFVKNKEKNGHLLFFNSTGDEYNMFRSNEQKLSLYIKLYEGDFHDKYYIANISFSLPNNLTDKLLYSITNNENINIILSNLTLNLYSCTFFSIENKKLYNDSILNLTFYINDKEYLSENFEQICNLYSKIVIEITNQIENIKLLINAKMKYESYESRVLNYSLCLTLFSIIKMHFSLNELFKMRENSQIGTNKDLFTIGLQIFWDCFICLFHLFLSIYYENVTYEFGMPSASYFFLISFFSFRILVTSWKNKNSNLYYVRYKKYLTRAILFFAFYLILFFCLLFQSSSLINNYLFIYIFFTCTWLFQIAYSVYYDSRPSMSYEYILINTLGRIIFIFYLRGCDNIFNLKHNYFRVFIISFILLSETLIICSQKLFSPKCIIPVTCRKKRYSYYIKRENIPNINDECAICCDVLDNELRLLKIKKVYENYEYIKNSGVMEKIKRFVIKFSKRKRETNWMITPCKHVFHSICLENWIDVKNECPLCRCKLPSLE